MKCIFLIFSLLLTVLSLSGVEIKKAEVIPIDQSSIILQKVYKFSVTEDEYFILPDENAGNIKIYDSKGKLAKVWGRKGFGPDEYVYPRYCDYRKPYFILMDWGHRKLFVFKRENTLNFRKLHESLAVALGYDVKFIDKNRILVSGYIAAPDGKEYELYLIDPETDKRKFFIPGILKYGYSSEKELKTAYLEKIATISISGYFDYFGDYIYYVWAGNLKMFKIDLNTGKIDYFGKKTENYITPFVTAEHLKMYNNRDKNLHIPKQKMSFVTGVFADDDFVGAIYANYKKNADAWQAFVQFYTHKGEFIIEKELEGALNMDYYPESYFFYSREKDTLYFLAHTTDKEFEDIYKIVKYKIGR